MTSELNISNVTCVDHEQFIEIVERTYETKLSLFVLGRIGIGKSVSVRQAAKNKAKEYNLEFIETKSPNENIDKFCLVDLRLAQKDAGEILGLPETYAQVVRFIDTIEKDKTVTKQMVELIPLKILTTMLQSPQYKDAKIVNYVTKWSMPSWYPIAGRGIIFIDEFNLAPPLVQYSMYELINDRCLGDYKLPDGWVVIGAGNRGTADGAPVFDFPSPLNNRFVWYELGLPKVEGWTAWALNNGIDRRIITFIQIKNGALYNFDPKRKEKAFATPRSWSKASDMIRDINDEAKIVLYISGIVGTALAGEFASFLQMRRLLPPTEDFIKHPETMEIPEKGDMRYTLAGNLVDWLVSHKTSKDKNEVINILRAITIISTRLWKECKQMEYAVFLLKLTKMTDESFFRKEIIKIPEFADMSGIIRKYLL